MYWEQLLLLQAITQVGLRRLQWQFFVVFSIKNLKPRLKHSELTCSTVVS